MSQKNHHALQGQKSSSSILEKIVAWGILIIFALLPLLYFSNRIAASVTSKEYFFMGLVDVMVGAWVWLLIKDARYRLSKKNLIIFLPLFLFLMSFTISSIFGVNPSVSFWGVIESGTGMVFLYHCFFFALIIASLIRVHGKDFFKKILQANLFASTILAIAVFFTPYGFDIGSKMLQESRGGAMIGNSSLTGAYFVFSIFLTAILFFMEREKIKKVFYAVGIAIVVLCPVILNTAAVIKGSVSISQMIHSPTLAIGQARMAVLSIVLGMVLSLFLWLALATKNKWKKIVGIMGAVGVFLVIVLGIWQLFVPSSSLQKFFLAQTENRTTFWREAFEGIAERPILGTGEGNFDVTYQKHLDPALYNPGRGEEVFTLHPHNSFIEIVSDGGIVAFIFYVSLIVALVWILIRAYREKKLDAMTFAFLSGLLFAYILQNQLVFDSINSYVMFFGVIAIVAGFFDVTEESFSPRNKISDTQYFFGSVVIAILIPIWIFAAYLPARKSVEAERTIIALTTIRATKYAHLFQSVGAYSIDNEMGFLILDNIVPSFYAGVQAGILNNATNKAGALTDIQSLINSMNATWNPNTTDYRLALSGVEIENLKIFLSQTVTQDDVDNVKKFGDRAIELSPTDPEIYIVMGEFDIYNKNISDARSMIDIAVNLNPDYLDADTLQVGFEKEFGTQEQYRQALANAQKYFPDNSFTAPQ